MAREGQAALFCDWLSVRFRFERRDDVLKLLSPLLGDPLDEVGSGGRSFFHHALVWASGARLYFAPRVGNLEGWELLSINGSAMGLISPQAQLDLMWALRKLGGVCTRLDLAFDDFDRVASMDDVHAAGAAGHYCGYRVYDPRRPTARGEGRKGDTAYFGSRGENGAGKFTRIYDKFLESKGLINSIRYEHELHDDRARQVFELLAQAPDLAAFSKGIGEIIGGLIDFRAMEGNNDRHKDRYPRLAWWAAILARIGSATVTVRRAIPDLQRCLHYFKRAWGKRLSLAVRVIERQGFDGAGVLLDLIRASAGKVSDRMVEAVEAAGGLDLPALLGLGPCDVPTLTP